MILVWMATFPAMFFGMFNIGHQAAMAIADGFTIGNSWQAGLFQMFGGELSATSG